MTTPRKPKAPEPPPNPWPARLKALRARLGISQAEAARRVRADMTTWQGWEYGRRTPSPMVELLLELVFGKFPD